jgi:hypothetical protein
MNHIRNSTAELYAWCGKELDNTFHFKDTEAAVINGVHGDIVPCTECFNTVVHYLSLRVDLGL